jgi:hypothetical protein
MFLLDAAIYVYDSTANRTAVRLPVAAIDQATAYKPLQATDR